MTYFFEITSTDNMQATSINLDDVAAFGMTESTVALDASNVRTEISFTLRSGKTILFKRPDAKSIYEKVKQKLRNMNNGQASG